MGQTPQVPEPAPAPAPPPPPNRVYVSFSAEINANTTESLIATIANCVNQGKAEIYLMISTPGGSVMHGLNIYNVLRAFPVKLVTHNVGNVDSIGNAIFLAGEERYACPPLDVHVSRSRVRLQWAIPVRGKGLQREIRGDPC